MKLTDIKGIGNKKKEILSELGIESVRDLYTYLPNRYEDRSNKIEIINSIDGVKHYYELECLTPARTYFYGSNRSTTRLKAKDDTGEINIIWYNDRFTSKSLETNKIYKFYGTYNAENKAIVNPIVSKIEDDLIGGIIPIYSFKKGISSREIIKFKDSLIEDDFRIDDYIDSHDLEQYNILEINEIYRTIHKPENHIELYKALFDNNLRKVFIEKLANKIFLENLNKDYIKFSKYNIDDIINNLDYDLTKDQIEALKDIELDMYSEKRMNRIIIGDVGSGKTIIAILSAILAIKNNYQVAFMAPTEILAIQHYNKYKEFLSNIGIKSELLIGATKQSDKKKIYEKLSTGDLNIVFGTHALFQENVEFNKLGLIITDEQQRFGVFQRKLLAEKGLNPDILLLSATPIPRTLALSLYNNLDISFIETLPQNRLEIKSYVASINQEKNFMDFAYNRIKNNEQAYVVVSRVEEDENLESVDRLYKKLKKYFDNKIRIDTLHGQMSSEDKETKQNLFNEGKIDLLIATSIIEVGIDNPNATVMIIYDSNQFGLSQLHQIRGRVGRSDLQSYCFFVLGKDRDLDEKIEFISKTNNGFEIAKKDLELRGAGELFGKNQSGFIEIENHYLYNEELIDKVNDLIEKIDITNKNLLNEINYKLDILNEIILN